MGRAGGFGEVFRGTDEDGNACAVKRLNIDAEQAAHRELRIARELAKRHLEHVMPIYDSGQDANSERYYLVMPLAEKSLQNDIDAAKGWSDFEAAEILTQIAIGLREIADITHRDLKPDNVLFHGGRWKIADFGISKFIEDSTSLQTLKQCLTPPYAAPEQWQLETTSVATDIYALGCIGYALLTGAPPFDGSNWGDFQRQHVAELPRPIEGHNAKLAGLLGMMLRKEPEVRPSLSRVIGSLETIPDGGSATPDDVGFAALTEAGAAHAARLAEQEAASRARKMEFDKRNRIAEEARSILQNIRDVLFGKIVDLAPTAEVQEDRIGLDRAHLTFLIHKEKEPPGLIMPSAFPQLGWDVVTAGILSVKQHQPSFAWSATLWYADTTKGDGHRWREVGYMPAPFYRAVRDKPFSIEDISIADQEGIGRRAVCQIAYGPIPIDDEDLEGFIDRWAFLLAKAADGKLRSPRDMPCEISNLKQLI